MVLQYVEVMEQQGKTAPDRDAVQVRFLDLVPCVWVVTGVRFLPEHGSDVNEMVMTWEIRLAKGGVELCITAEHVPENVSEKDHPADMASSREKLAHSPKRAGNGVWGDCPQGE